MILKRFFLLGFILLLDAILVAAAQANDRPVPPLGTVSLDNLTFSGSGCNPKTAVTAEISENQFELQLTTPTLTASVNPLKRKARRDSCTIILDIAHPQEWQFAISNVVSHSGYASLAQGISGNVHSNYYFQGTPTQATFELTIKGPYIDTFSFHSKLLSGEELFSPCDGGRSLIFNNEVRINPQGSPTAEMTGNTITVGKNNLAVFVYGLQWRQC